MHERFINMRENRYIPYITALVLSFFSAFATAQSLPEMPADPMIEYGVLPNGTNYYVIANGDTKGMADFALVQKSGKDASVDLLASLPDLGNMSPRKFFSENGVVPREGRFVERRDGAAVYRFGEVMISGKPVLLDSTLLVIMGIIEAGQEHSAPSESAVIVSGDIKPAEVVEKMRLLSYMVPAGCAGSSEEYVWKDADAVFSVHPSEDAISVVSVSWRLPRTPEELAGTIQPAVHAKLMDELGRIAAGRVRHEFGKRDIPFTGLSFRHVSSAETSSDEEFSISLATGQAHVGSAVSAMSEALSSIRAKGVSVEEQSRSKVRFIHGLFDKARRPVRSDAANVELCINAFLNKATPVTDAWRYGFHLSKAVNDTVEALALSKMAAAVMSVDKNVSVHVHTSSNMSVDSLKNGFLSAWNASSGSDAAEVMPVSDTLKNLTPGQKSSVSLFWKEHLSGGTLWKFDNGIRVAYKRMDTGGRFYWACGLSGGYGGIRDLAAGEGAFVTDMLKLSKVAGMPWEDFISFLESRDIYLDASVGLFNTIIRGSAPTYEMPLLMRALRAVANEREFDREAFSRYLRNEWLSLEMTAGSSRRVVDSLMCPGYRYSKIKTSGKLSDALPAKAEALFDEIFSKMNDGILVIVGDKDESLVRKELMGYMGGFATRKRIPARPSVSYQPISGAMTHIAEGHRNAVYLAMSVPMPLTIDNYAVAEVAGMMLKKKLSSALVGSGMYAKVYCDTKIAPHERFNVMVVLEEVPGAAVQDAEEGARKLVREAFGSEVLSDMTDAQVDACKKWLKHNHSVRSKGPDYWVDAILLRYLDGKDFTTGYDKRIDAVSVEDVRALLASLYEAGKVEYIIRKK